jgi:hypothetical protein
VDIINFLVEDLKLQNFWLQNGVCGDLGGYGGLNDSQRRVLFTHSRTNFDCSARSCESFDPATVKARHFQVSQSEMCRKMSRSRCKIRGLIDERRLHGTSPSSL